MTLKLATVLVVAGATGCVTAGLGGGGLIAPANGNRDFVADVKFGGAIPLGKKTWAEIGFGGNHSADKIVPQLYGQAFHRLKTQDQIEIWADVSVAASIWKAEDSSNGLSSRYQAGAGLYAGLSKQAGPNQIAVFDGIARALLVGADLVVGTESGPAASYDGPYIGVIFSVKGFFNFVDYASNVTPK